MLRAVACHARQAHLHAHIAKSLRHQLPCVVNDLFEVGATGVRVGIGGFAALAASQLVDGHAGLAALDVPQSLVDAADGIVQYRAVFPVRAVVAGLPDVFDAIGGFADEERLEVSLDCGLHQVGALREGMGMRFFFCTLNGDGANYQRNSTLRIDVSAPIERLTEAWRQV